MEADALLHDLTAAYALDALDNEGARAYEAHLARCERCREELASLSDAASTLAYATEAPAPPPELRARILHQAERERPNVVPLRRRWVVPVAATAVAVAACVAIGLGLWASSLSDKLDRRTEALARQERVAEILARPDSRRISFSRGTLVVTATGEGALVLNKLEQPGSGRTYEAWVADGGAPQPAGLFKGGDVVAVPLERPVRPGATVMVTKEPAGGTKTPSRAPFVIVRNAAQS
jgi:anti-sigma-K factor RskA